MGCVPRLLARITHFRLMASMSGKASSCSTSPPGSARSTGGRLSPRTSCPSSGFTSSRDVARVFVRLPRDPKGLVRGPDAPNACAIAAAIAASMDERSTRLGWT
eukprot:scaffold285_cov330-Pavlova_lutheri.AAC.34